MIDIYGFSRAFQCLERVDIKHNLSLKYVLTIDSHGLLIQVNWVIRIVNANTCTTCSYISIYIFSAEFLSQKENLARTPTWLSRYTFVKKNRICCDKHDFNNFNRPVYNTIQFQIMCSLLNVFAYTLYIQPSANPMTRSM